MRVAKPANKTPCYCTECGAADAIRVRFENKSVVQNASFAVCLRHAESLGSMLIQRVRQARYAAMRAAQQQSPGAQP